MQGYNTIVWLRKKELCCLKKLTLVDCIYTTEVLQSGCTLDFGMLIPDSVTDLELDSVKKVFSISELGETVCNWIRIFDELVFPDGICTLKLHADSISYTHGSRQLLSYPRSLQCLSIKRYYWLTPIPNNLYYLHYSASLPIPKALPEMVHIFRFDAGRQLFSKLFRNGELQFPRCNVLVVEMNPAILLDDFRFLELECVVLMENSLKPVHGEFSLTNIDINIFKEDVKFVTRSDFIFSTLKNIIPKDRFFFNKNFLIDVFE